MGVVVKKKKPSESELLKQEFKKAMTDLKDWAIFGLPLPESACKTIEKSAVKLSGLYDKDKSGELFTKEKKKESMADCSALLEKLNDHIKNRKILGKDVSAANAAVAVVKEYIGKIRMEEKPKEKMPTTTFSTIEHEKTTELKVSWMDYKTEKCITSTIEIPNEKLEHWVEEYAELLAGKEVKEGYKPPVLDEILGFFGVKAEFRMHSNSMLVLITPEKKEEYVVDLMRIVELIKKAIHPEAKFQVLLGPPRVDKSWKLQAAEKVLNDVIAAAQYRAVLIKAEKEEKEKKKVAELVGKKLAKKFPVK